MYVVWHTPRVEAVICLFRDHLIWWMQGRVGIKQTYSKVGWSQPYLYRKSSSKAFRSRADALHCFTPKPLREIPHEQIRRRKQITSHNVALENKRFIFVWLAFRDTWFACNFAQRISGPMRLHPTELLHYIHYEWQSGKLRGNGENKACIFSA